MGDKSSCSCPGDCSYHAPLGAKWLLVLVGMALAGMLIATVFAYKGQARTREQTQLEMVRDRFAAEDSLRRGELYHAAPDEMARRKARYDETRHPEYISYLRPGRQFTQWDGFRYEEIAREGYVYEKSDDATVTVPYHHHAWEEPLGAPRMYPVTPANPLPPEIKTEPRLKNVVWYPLYPMMGRMLASVSGIEVHHALTAISWFCIAAASVVMFIFVRRHLRTRTLSQIPMAENNPPAMSHSSSADFGALWAVALLLYGPCSIFLYANYTESLFVLLLASFLLSLQSRAWWCAAGIAAIASACRSQGCLFAPVLVLIYLLRADVRGLARRIPVALILGAVSGIGIICYMAYLWRTFGDPLAFVKTQQYWGVGMNKTTIAYAFNPVNSATHLIHVMLDWPIELPRLYEACAVVAPPVVFLLGRRYLNLELTIMAWVLWGLPFVTNSMAGSEPGEDTWMSMGRFMAVVIPLYVIYGSVLVRYRWFAPAALALSAAAFAYFSFVFGAGQWVG